MRKIYYTTAPISYDGFSTEDLGRVGEQAYGLKGVVRKISVEEKDEEWQICRYHSGLHLSIHEDRLDEFVGWNIILDEDPRRGRGKSS